MAVMLSLRGVALARGDRRLVEDLTLDLVPGTLTALAGPNGAGKSTLLESLAGDFAPVAGTIHYGRTDLAEMSLSRRAEVRAMLRQQSDVAFDFRVADIVAMGLSPHGLAPQAALGAALVAQALADLELEPLADRSASQLSGGEGQRVHLARCFVQLRAGRAQGEGGVLLLDEPTTGLDYRHQLALLRLLKSEAAAGATVVASLHDLSYACRLADRLLLLGGGRLLADVAPSRLQPELIASLYRIEQHEAELLLAPWSRPVLLAHAAE